MAKIHVLIFGGRVRCRRWTTAACLVLAALLAMSAMGNAAPANVPVERRNPEVIPGRYIVTFKPGGVAAGALTRRLSRVGGFAPSQTYEHAVRGFAARLSPRQVNDLRVAPEIASIVPDRVVRAADAVAPGDTVPTGVRRIGPRASVDAAGGSSANVAVLDSGTDLDHPDLNARHGINCVGSDPAEDDNGHGTHVAGTIGALNNGAGVTGVAPGTAVYAVKVLDTAGAGSVSQEICGLDWVTSTRSDDDPANDIAVANMSLGGTGSPVSTCSLTTDPEHLAVCRATAAGVVVVAAAGNDGWDFDHATYPDTPAAFPEVLTVTAMADTDGLPGGVGASRCVSTQADDSYLARSSFAETSAGANHVIAAPGFCIQSTTIDGGYATRTGTSMAAPHVAGAVALCIDQAGVAGRCADVSPRNVIDNLRRHGFDRRAVAQDSGFTGDPFSPLSGKYFGFLVAPPHVDVVRPEATAFSPGEYARVSPATPVEVTFSEAMDTAATEQAFSLRSTSTGVTVAGTFSWSDRTLLFTPTVTLPTQHDYEIEIGEAAADLEGNRPGGTAWSRFSTWQLQSSPPTSVTRQIGTALRGDASSLRAVDSSTYRLASTTTATKRTQWSGLVDVQGLPTKVTAVTRYSRRCMQKLSIFDHAAQRWTPLDAREVGTTQASVAAPLGGLGGEYADANRRVRVRVQCATTAGTFTSYANMLRIRFAV